MISRQKSILEYLINKNGYSTSQELVEKFNVTDRTIRKDLLMIEDELQQCHATLLRHHKYGYLIRSEDKSLILQFQEEKFFEQQQFFPKTPEQRSATLILFLLSSDQPYSLSKFSEVMYISKSSAKKDFDEAIKILTDLNIKQKQTPKGTMIEANEARRRLIMNYICMYHLKEPRLINVVFYMIYKADYPTLYDKIRKEVIDAIHFFQYQSKDISIQFFINSCLISYIRMNQGFSIHFPFMPQSKFVDHMKDKIQDILKLNDAEWYSLEKEFFDRTVSRVKEEEQHYAMQIIEDFLEVANRDHHLLFDENEIEFLRKEIERILSNSKNKVMEKNTYKNRIIQKYPLAFEVAMNFKILIQSYNYHILLDDIASLALYINSVLQKKQDPLSILIVSELGELYVNSLSINIRNTIHYPNVNIATANEYEVFQKCIQKQYDLIVSTDEKLRHDIEKNKVVYICVSPLYEGEDVELLNSIIEQYIRKRRVEIKKEALTQLTDHMDYSQFERIEQSHFYFISAIKHMVNYKEGVLLVKTDLKKNYIHCFHLREPFIYQNQKTFFLIEYSTNVTEFELHKKVFIMISFILKYTQRKEIMNLQHKNAFIAYLQRRIESII